MLILASDVDNLGVAFVVYFLMTQHKMNYSGAAALVRERRISLKFIQIIHTCFQSLQMNMDK